MKTKNLTSVAAGLLLACAGLANAAEPVALTDTQMDSVAAGTAPTGITFNTTTAQSVSIGRFNASIASATALAFAPGRGAVSAAYAAAVGY